MVYHHKNGLFTGNYNHLGKLHFLPVKKFSNTNGFILFYCADVLDEVDDLVRITPLVVIPGNELDEFLVEHDAGLGIEDRGARIAEEVGGDDHLVRVADDALQLALGCLLHGGADRVVIRGGLEVGGEVDDGDVQGRDAHGHAGELAREVRDDLADGLGGAGGGGDDVAGGSSAAAPVLNGRAVDSALGGGGGVDGGHKAALDAEVVVDNLGERSEAVRGAGGVGDDLHVALVGLFVDAHDEHRGIRGRSGDDDLLGAGLEVGFGLFHLGEETGGLDDEIGVKLAPGQLGRVLLAENGNVLAVDDDGLLGVGDRAVKHAVHRVVLEHICHIIRGEHIVDADELDIFVLETCAEYETSDSAETVDANSNLAHVKFLLKNISKSCALEAGLNALICRRCG